MMKLESQLQSLGQGVPDVSIVVVAYKSMDYLHKCLGSIKAYTQGPSYEVLVIDNSDDGAEAMVRRDFPWVRWIDNHENLGFAAGNNRAAREARGRYLLFLNPDTELRDNAISSLWRTALSNPEAGVWGGVTLLPDGRIDPGCRQDGAGIIDSMFHTIGLGRLRRPKPIAPGQPATPVPTISGAFFMMERSFYESLGGFDESFRLYSEELDLCRRARKCGRAVVMTGRATVIHDAGSGARYSPSRTLAMIRGHMHLHHRHDPPIICFVAAALVWLHAVIRVSGSMVLGWALGSQRVRDIRKAYGPIILKPGQWYYGWRGCSLSQRVATGPGVSSQIPIRPE